MRRKTFGATVICVSLLLAAAQAQSTRGEPSDRLEQGLQRFEKADFSAALSLFQGLLLDAGAKRLHPDAAYWSALSYVGLKDYDNADRTMGLFLSSYPSSALYSDARYHQGRIAFLKQEYERALGAFQAFLEAYPKSDLYVSGLFWAGECMYQLGKLSQAEQVFQAIVKEYPEGVKTEAATYRLGLIDLKYREEELLKLLKWSHEESLRIIEEYQQREKTYEQALNAYQKQVATQKGSATPTADASKLSDLEAQAASLKAAADSAAAETAALKKSLSDAQAARDEALAALTAAKVSPDAAQAAAMQKKKDLLSIKEEALELKEYYLQRLTALEEGGAAK